MVKKVGIFAAIAGAFAALGALLFSRTARGSEGVTPVNHAPIEEIIVTTKERTPRGSSPAGLRNNNPFNLEYHAIGWVGETGSNGRFSVFNTAENGIRAGMINIHTKMFRDGAKTVRKLLTILSPAFENPLEAYITFVAGRLNVAPDQPLDYAMQIIRLSKAIIQFENGVQPYSDDELHAALVRTGKV